MEAGRAGGVAAGPPVAGTADTFPCHSITGPLNTGGAGGAAVFPKGASGAGVFTPGPQPARVTALTVASIWLTDLPTSAVRALLSAALAKGARQAGLLALGSVPARLAGLTAPCVWRARLIVLAVATAGKRRALWEQWGWMDGAPTPSNPCTPRRPSGALESIRVPPGSLRQVCASVSPRCTMKTNEGSYRRIPSLSFEASTL